MTKAAPANSKSGSIAWSCPSNIALIKYWGKSSIQIPKNPSLSVTLTRAKTLTKINYHYHPENRKPILQFRFEGKTAPAFEDRIRRYLNSIRSSMPHLNHSSLEIDSENTFPHSSGIASSASALGALALCLVQMEEELFGTTDRSHFLQRASLFARLGSGSASRSVYPHLAMWGETEGWTLSSDLYAIPVTGFHSSFHNLRDAILIVETGQKRVSSTDGHALMDSNPFAANRFQQARQNMQHLLRAIKEGNWDRFIALVEEEALTLHAMMMTSKPGYLLMRAGTIRILHLIREFRQDTGCKLGFTLDAGANVHLLYAENDLREVEQFIHSELLSFCENGKVIKDQMGPGPQKMEL